tara:strand:- start:491 stop:1573 length:1083 start_codon:yes stop_codon:yes gene_type:complete
MTLRAGLKQVCVTGVALTCLLMPGVTHAEQTVLRIADYLPSGHFISKFMAEVWMGRVAELTNGEVTFDYFPGEQLGKAKDLLSLTQSGVVDVGLAAPSYITDKLPLSGVAELPEAFSNSCEGTLAYWSLVKPGGIIDQNELEPLGVRALFSLVLAPYQFYLARAPIDGVNAAQGLKLRAPGGPKVLMTRRLGGVPVQMGAPEIMESLSRGTIDGLFLSHSSIADYDLHHHLKYGTEGENFGSAVIMYVINLDTWKETIPEVQQAFTQAGEEVVESACKETDKDSIISQKVIEEAGVTFVELSAKDRASFRTVLAGVNQQWAEDLDRRGKPGTKVLRTFQRSLEKRSMQGVHSDEYIQPIE